MEEGASLLLGEKDFIAFQNSSRVYSTTVRSLEKISILGENLLYFTLIGNSFLYKMVRNIVGTLVYIGQGKLKPSDIPKILASKQRAYGGVTAPAHGLILKKVYYDLAQ